VIIADPVPLVGLAVAHAESLVVTHAQVPGLVVRVTA
jgi:hypothetical protein